MPCVAFTAHEKVGVFHPSSVAVSEQKLNLHHREVSVLATCVAWDFPPVLPHSMTLFCGLLGFPQSTIEAVKALGRRLWAVRCSLAVREDIFGYDDPTLRAVDGAFPIVHA